MTFTFPSPAFTGSADANRVDARGEHLDIAVIVDPSVAPQKRGRHRGRSSLAG
jgi:hypothetical protein